MATIDSRLADPTILLLAARRCQARQQTPEWRTCEGLSAVLQAAKGLPPRSPWALPSVEDGDGLAGLLREARQWEQEHGHGD